MQINLINTLKATVRRIVYISADGTIISTAGAACYNTRRRAYKLAMERGQTTLFEIDRHGNRSQDLTSILHSRISAAGFTLNNTSGN